MTAPGDPRLQDVVCDLCGSARRRTAYRVQDTNYGLPGEFTLVTCLDCGLTYLNPRPAGDALAAYYPVTYHPFRATRGAATPGALQEQRAAALSRCRPGRALDIGCGSGLFLLALRARGWAVAGVEPAEQAAMFARDQLGLPVIHGTLDDLPAETAPFDLVTLWDVLEHVPSPRRVLMAIAKHHLRPGGTLALNVPNFASLERLVFGARWTALDAPRHLTHFTPATLRRLVEQAGFTVTHVATDAPVLTLASNVLRLAGDVALRGGRSKARTANDHGSGGESPTAPRRRGPLRSHVITATHGALRPLNALANRLGRGATIQLTATLPDV